MAKQQAMILDLMNEIKLLKNLVKEKEKTIDDLQQRLDDLEQYARREDVVLSGLDVKHRTYARAVAGVKVERTPQPRSWKRWKGKL